MIFPIEIWEKIFSFADPINLLQLKSVCKCWKEIIDRTLREKDHWKRKCKADIPTDVWDTIFEKLFPYGLNMIEEEDKINSDMWMTMYKLWTNLKRVTKTANTVESFKPLPVHRPSEVITCVRITNSLLAIGSTEGYIYFFDINDLDKHVTFKADHMEHISDIQYCIKQDNLIAISVSINDSVKFWNLKTGEQIKCIPGNMICASTDYSYVLIENIVLGEGSSSKMLYQLDLYDLVAITATKDRVSLYSESGHYVTMKMGREDWESCTMHFIRPPPLNTRRYFLFKNDVILCITECGYLGLSVKGKDWQIYNIFPILNAIPTAALVYINLLILGLDSGEIYIFNVGNFEMLDFETMESIKITLDTEAVVSLDITILSAEPCVIAVDRKKVHIIRFILSDFKN